MKLNTAVGATVKQSSGRTTSTQIVDCVSCNFGFCKPVEAGPKKSMMFAIQA